MKKFLQKRNSSQQNLYTHPSYSLELKLIDSISRGDSELALLTLNEINSNERASLANRSLRSLKNSLICTCTLFTRAAITGGVVPEDAFHLSDVYIGEIENLTTLSSLQALEYEMLDSFIKTVKGQMRPAYHPVVNKALTYIKEHILTSMSLEDIAKHVQVHPNYLSSLFKSNVGESLISFMNRKKVEESKYFLHHSESSLLDIAHLFGFCNQSYYSSLFKKYTGTTPRHYRNHFFE